MERTAGITFSSGKDSHYRATQLLLGRKRKGLQEQALVKWSKVGGSTSSARAKSDGKGSPSEKEGAMVDESPASKEVLMWMSKGEILACCPHLIEATSSSAQETERNVERAACKEHVSFRQQQRPATAGQEEENDSLHELSSDVASLVARAKRITQRLGRNPVQASSERLLADIVNILSAYAKLGSLAHSFRQCGALDLLLELLSSQLPNIRKSASDMLRALSAHDSASRAYVLLHLANREQSSGNGGDMPTLENRQMLVELFAETSSQDEEKFGMANVSLPQIPGRFVYSLLKQYLRVTSLSIGSKHAQPPFDLSTHPPSCSSSPLLPPTAAAIITDSSSGKATVAEEEFEYFSGLFHLLSELFVAFGWTEHQVRRTFGDDPLFKIRGQSIFTGDVASVPLALARQKKMFKTRSDFGTNEEYGQYVKSVLSPGMRVRARFSYESVVEGDIGEYRQTNEGTPPAQFAWEGLGGDTYWVFWHLVEPLANEPLEEDKTKEVGGSVSRAVRQPYTLLSTHPSSSGDGDETVPRPHWWEVVCLIKDLPQSRLEEVATILGHSEIKTVAELSTFSPTYYQAVEVLVHLESSYPHLSLELLTLRRESRFWEIYKPLSLAGKEEEEGGAKEKCDDDNNVHPFPPYPDPYDVEEPLAAAPGLFAPGGSTLDSPVMLFRTLFPQSIDLEPLASLMAAEDLLRCSEFSLQKVEKQCNYIEKHIEKSSFTCKVAVHSLKVLKVAIDKLVDEIDRIECCVTAGLFRLILKIMHKHHKSVTVQNLGLTCFFLLMGGASLTDYLPLTYFKNCPAGMSSSTQTTIVATIMSLLSVSESGPGLKTLVNGLACVADNYNLEMTSLQKMDCQTAARNGLCIVLTLLSQSKFCGTSTLLAEWGMAEVVEKIRRYLPDFSMKDELCSCIIVKMSGSAAGDKMMESMAEAEGKEEDKRQVSKEIQGDKDTSDNGRESEGIESEVISAVALLRYYTHRHGRNPIPRLLKLIAKDLCVGQDTFVCPPPLFTQTFLRHAGVLSLAEALAENKSTYFLEGALLLLGCLSLARGKEAATVVLQGGLRAAILAMFNNQTKLAVLLFCNFLNQLLTDADLQVVVIAENVVPVLKSCRDKLSYESEVSVTIQKVLDLLSEVEKKGVCEPKKVAVQNSRTLGAIFLGVLQLALAEVEDARRLHTLPFVPQLACLIQFLSSGGGVTMSERGQCFERLEVSSSSYRRSRLTDGDSSSYWESSGRSGSHWIRLYIKKGVVIRRLAIDVSSSDGSYMPQNVVVLGGSSTDGCMEINSVRIPSGHTGIYDILSNARVHYPILLIQIKRCQQGGIDTRVRGLICEGGRLSLWPLFGRLFSLRTQLFYTILSHTWAQDAAIGPLEMFDRVSATVSHEQMFADRYFHMEELRHCLGQACREALLDPLVVTLARRNESGVSLSGLLRYYLAHIRPPIGCSSPLLFFLPLEMKVAASTAPHLNASSDPTVLTRLVEMSRIRRMCRLLVECSGSSVSLSLGKSDCHQPMRKDGASAVTMATCWQEIIATEVLACLRKCESMEPPLLVMVELLMLYDKLRQSTMELFGGHSQFALALKEGFSTAFQGLNEVEGVQLCELLCLSINMLMDAAGKESSNLQHLSESLREEVLLNLSEPLQFLHNLDIAAIFEHFYKRHLSSRLLRHRSISLSMEKRLAHALVHCFPNKYPLQMLMDLDESHHLMERFRQSDQLERLDQLLHGWQAQGASMPIPEATLEYARKAFFYRSRNLSVLVLTPCHWQLKHRPLAPSALPPPLDTFLSDYENYFATVFRGVHQDHQKAKKLHWTLYGSSTVTYTDIQLTVSTTQMLVLVQFNGSEELSYKALLESTLLPVHELTDTLLSLTSEHQPLLSSIPPPSLCSRPHKFDPALEEEAFSFPFLPQTLFSVNKFFVDGLVARGVSELHVHGVKSMSHLPVNRPGRFVDLAHVFERRRAIIDASIIRILKRERSTSMDNIALKVIKGCSVGYFEGGATFGRFLCGFKDVCSRVECLVVSGYIKRDSDHPQMLIYIPDPAEGTSANTSQSENPCRPSPPPAGCQDKPVKMIPREDGPLSEQREAQNGGPVKQQQRQLGSQVGGLSDPDSHYQTEGGSQDDALPQTVSSVLPSHSRKRPGSGSSPLTSAKRKQRVLHDMYPATDFPQQEEEVPLLNLRKRERSLSLEEVEVRVQEEVASVAAVLRIREDVVESLLYQSSWKKDLVIQRYLADSEAVLLECGLTGPVSVSDPNPTKSSISCPVCLLCVSKAESVCLWCQHGCCKHCWQEYLNMQIASLNRALLCTCPVNGCHARPTRSFISSLLQPGSKALHQYNKAVVHSYVEGSGWLTWCRNPQGCDQVLCWGEGVDSGTCSKCKWSSCFSCNYAESHQPACCSYVAKWVEAGGFYEGMDEDAKSKHLANVISKRCPGCNAQIEKNEGCLRMNCKCGHDFCWKCQKPWRPTHTDYFSCSATVSKAARDAKKFVDYNQRCASHHRSKLFSHKLCVVVKGVGEPVPMSTLTFLMDACELLVQCHKMLFYCCIMEFYTPPDSCDYFTVLSDDLEAGTSALQAFLENTLLASVDTVHSIRTLPDRKLHDGYRLVNKIEATREKLLIGSKQHFKLGESSSSSASKTDPKGKHTPKLASGTKDKAECAGNLVIGRPSSASLADLRNLSTENNSFDDDCDDDDDDSYYFHSGFDHDYYCNSSDDYYYNSSD